MAYKQQVSAKHIHWNEGIMVDDDLMMVVYLSSFYLALPALLSHGPVADLKITG